MSIEENPVCLEKASEHLKKTHKIHKIHKCKRSRIANLGHKYAVVYNPIPKLRDDLDCVLLDGNFIIDEPYMLAFLESYQFDAVICWLIGTTGHLISNCANLEPMSNCGPQEYRLSIQNRLYDLSHKWLKPGGILHIVDRGEYTEDPELIEDFINSHKAQADPTSFTIIENSFDQIKYQPDKYDQGIKMGCSPGTSGRVPNEYEHALHSITAQLSN